MSWLACGRPYGVLPCARTNTDPLIPGFGIIAPSAIGLASLNSSSTTTTSSPTLSIAAIDGPRPLCSHGIPSVLIATTRASGPMRGLGPYHSKYDSLPDPRTAATHWQFGVYSPGRRLIRRATPKYSVRTGGSSSAAESRLAKALLLSPCSVPVFRSALTEALQDRMQTVTSCRKTNEVRTGAGWHTVSVVGQ